MIPQALAYIKAIILHWTATGYAWCEAGHYHTVVTGDGKAHHLTPYTQRLYEATYGRNSSSVSLAVACMSPEGGAWANAATHEQLDAMCREAASLALQLGWPADAKRLASLIMTHAEAAGCRDYPRDLVERFSGKYPSSDWDHAAQAAGLPHANYGPSSWHDGWPGGDIVRWDLWQLHGPDEVGGTGGDALRKVIVQHMLAKK